MEVPSLYLILPGFRKVRLGFYSAVVLPSFTEFFWLHVSTLVLPSFA